ncbi:MAG TPA: ABC transporter permease [bacterium]
MFKNYLKIALRNIKKHKGFSFINVTGLAIGMAICILMLLWVRDELSFDRFHENGDQIYRVVSEIHTADHISRNARTPNPLGLTLKAKYPEIINFVRFQGFDQWLVKYEDKSFINDNLGTADPSFFEMLSFPFIKGDPKTALKDKNSIVITENMAKKYFGDEDPMGKVLKILEDFTVTGVIKNIPENSHFHFDCIFPIEIMESFWETNFDDWRAIRFYTYLQLGKNNSGEMVSQKIANVVRDHLPSSNTKIYLQPLRDVHLRSDFEWDLDNYAQGSMTYIYIFTLVAFCILLLACINFMNLSTARSMQRAKEVGMRKVSGAQRSDVIKQFFGESILLTFIALFLALILTELILPVFNNLSGKQLSLEFFNNFGFLIGLLGIALLTGIISGSYPAIFLSRFHPAEVLKGVSHWSTNRGTSLRKILVIFQFALTTILIIGTTVIYNQVNYIRNKNLGFNRDHIITFGSHHMNYEPFKNELLKNPNILSMTQSQAPNLQPWGVIGFNWEGQTPDQKDIMLYPVQVDYDYLKTFNIKMAEGRFFSKEFSTDATQAVVINETAAKVLGMKSPLGKKISHEQLQGTIIGVIKDFHQSSLHNQIEPLIFHIPEEFHLICAKLNSKNISKTLALIEKTWKKFVPNYPFTYEFLDKTIDNQYKAEQKISTIFKYFTILAIFIACLGLFGLASFMTEQRTKEIGIRKVLGASISGILFLLTREFTKWVLFANLIACPIAYLAMNKWLQNFAYRINLGVWIFVLSAVIALIVALVTVGYQAIKAALANPVESLRYE